MSWFSENRSFEVHIYSAVRNIGDRRVLEKRTHQVRVIGDCL